MDGGGWVMLRNGFRAAGAFVPAPWRYGVTYLRTLRWLSRTELESAERRRVRTSDQLASILRLATQQTAFWGRHGVSREGISGREAWEVLGSLPTIQKEQIRDAVHDFTRRDVPSH